MSVLLGLLPGSPIILIVILVITFNTARPALTFGKLMFVLAAILSFVLMIVSATWHNWFAFVGYILSFLAASVTSLILFLADFAENLGNTSRR